jgi:methyl-accepting chemotaxis protein
MMALNAAIEPATPVQPGMGFRAAAEQVRSLVHREGGRN